MRRGIIPMVVCELMGFMPSPILAASEPFIGEIMDDGSKFLS